ncbi:hypothetical protein [Actinoplanes sp. N902-109]|uniref:hypothetical protein n=1 Tax=Actinoplanes sp. (strain N902-109) TaxID=649831 RepID=UPI0003293B52|nr:hypothetical protein [Actinoplanes sp. N902-109]AGL18007.1 hypothetical protein L083_4497 [Actinoplanes sp. N902-109]
MSYVSRRRYGGLWPLPYGLNRTGATVRTLSVGTPEFPDRDGERAGLADAMRLDGPPDGGDLLLQRALRRIRAETGRRRDVIIGTPRTAGELPNLTT